MFLLLWVATINTEQIQLYTGPADVHRTCWAIPTAGGTSGQVFTASLKLCTGLWLLISCFLLLHGFNKKLNLFGFWDAANISTFRPKQEGFLHSRSLPAILMEAVEIRVRPRFFQKAKVPLSRAPQWHPHSNALITMQIPGHRPKLDKLVSGTRVQTSAS